MGNDFENEGGYQPRQQVVTSRTVVAMRRAVVSRAVSVRVSRDKVVAMPMAAVRSSVVETMIRMPSTHRKSVLSIRRKLRSYGAYALE